MEKNNLKKVFNFCAILIVLFVGIPYQGISQPLAGTDELGRILPLNDEVGNPKKNRQVGIFYFLWQGDPTSPTSAYFWDLSKIIPEHPEVLEDRDNRYWGSENSGFYYFWGEPLYGYYRGDDYWVHLRNMQLLTDAGIDFVVIDATNALTYPKQSEALMSAMDKIRAQGKNPPKIVYYTNTSSGKTMQEIYDNFYKPSSPYYHPACWYYLDGKPLIIGISKEAIEHDYHAFFTYRESQWPNEPQKINGWPWISFTRPQKVHYNDRGEAEIINVSVSQHPNPAAGMGGAAFYGNRDNWGRSYRHGSHGNPQTDIVYGYNFQEQWDYALQQDVNFIFITGWNEWIAGRWPSTDGNPEHSYFCDQASPEYSRDIEPTRMAGLNDNYYMQMVANIRRYKGIEPQPQSSDTISIKNFSDWKNVLPVYTDYIDDAKPRYHPGAQSKPAVIYTNCTGRNDLYKMKVARNTHDLFFYAETTENITGERTENWMQLYIDIDRNVKTGWQGYDYRIIEGNKIQIWDNKKWVTISKTTFMVDKNKLMITIPFQILRIENQPINIEFKWCDNMQNYNDPLEWYINGDAAPGGRFNYIYSPAK
jgi:hypothetical protein